jgi:hypothetical protein
MKNIMSFGAGMLSSSAILLGMYAYLNKFTKKKVDNTINNMLDKVNNSNIMK